MRRLSRPSSTTSSEMATYASATIARASVVSVTGLKKNLGEPQTLISGAYAEKNTGNAHILDAGVVFLRERLYPRVRFRPIRLPQHNHHQYNHTNTPQRHAHHTLYKKQKKKKPQQKTHEKREKKRGGGGGVHLTGLPATPGGLAGPTSGSGRTSVSLCPVSVSSTGDAGIIIASPSSAGLVVVCIRWQDVTLLSRGHDPDGSSGVGVPRRFFSSRHRPTPLLLPLLLQLHAPGSASTSCSRSEHNVSKSGAPFTTQPTCHYSGFSDRVCVCVCVGKGTHIKYSLVRCQEG